MIYCTYPPAKKVAQHGAAIFVFRLAFQGNIPVVFAKGVTVRPIFRLLIASGLLSAGVPLVARTEAPVATTAPARPEPAYDALDCYATQQINGWTILVNKRLLETKDPSLAQAVLRELEHQLYQVERRVPGKVLPKLRTVKIWIELKDGDVVGGCYHPNVDWLKSHGFNPAKAKGVEFGNARNFVDWSITQPFMVLHEFAHAYHDQVLGYDYAPLKQAYRNAVASKRYEAVLHLNGHIERHYALNNDQEFFAEMSEAFFGTNDFYPFVRGELKTYDPETYRTVAQAWGIDVPAEPPTTRPVQLKNASH